MTGECWGGPWDGLRHSCDGRVMRVRRGQGTYRWLDYCGMWMWDGPEKEIAA